MTLSLHDRRILADMERRLMREDPGFADRLAAFDRLLASGAPPGARPGAPPPPPPLPPQGPRRARWLPRAHLPAGWVALVALALVVAALIADAPVVLAAAACVTVVAVFLKAFGSRGFDEREGEHADIRSRLR